jgi:regulation of enolase protein 1 (concanavalin A-like superfamily)
MRDIFYSIFIGSLLLCCDSDKSRTPSGIASNSIHNMSDEIISELEWLNEAESFQIMDSSLSVTVTKGSDFFNSPEDNSIVASAPFLYRSIKGDFVAKVLVQPDFNSQWNAVALMVHCDSLNWIKLAFENSDATGPGIVTVVTKGTSDDANGVILNKQTQIWLAIVRKNNIYSMHWSKDGKSYKMARLTSLPELNEVKIGIEVQSPVGDEATHTIHFFETKERTVKNLRILN